MTPELRDRAAAWIAVDPDPDTRAELERLVAADDGAGVADRFDGRLQFGTAGLRGALGAGPMRMNRVVVRRAAWGLVQYLLRTDPRTAERGIVIGYDARRNSDVFALDSARVAAALGVRSMLLPHRLPTPVLAFSITELDAAAGVMVTASHNPPQDNGYKVYLGDGAQIVPPHDTGISAEIDRAPADVPVSAEDDPLISTLDGAVIRAYVEAIRPATATDVRVAYTPMHGVGGEVLLAAFEHAGLPAPHVVEAQFQPDPSFPTVSFPNPEEPGAMDLLLELAASCAADIALANDPDADRLGAAIPTPDGGWRRLGGDELGWLLADHLLSTTTGGDRLVITTLVSSTLLGEMAAAHGVRYAETFTGFKWIARMVLDHPEWQFLFGYEQALGYLVASRPLDKDGISAAVMMAEVAATAKASGETLQQRLDAIADRYGRHLTQEHSIKMDPAVGAVAVAAMQAKPPAELAGHPVTEVTWFEEAGLLRLQCGPTARVQVRPSGTEPKVKVYAEAVGADPAPLVDALVAYFDSCVQT
ncbi:MAG: phospho-sugar mutase [Acidimicrobiia bacterium]